MTDTLTSSTAKNAESTTSTSTSATAGSETPKAGSALTSPRFVRYLAELCGTTLVVFVVLIAGAMTTMTSDLTLVALAAFVVYTAASYVFVHVSGAHLNPAVTLAAALTGRLDWPDALGYLISQVLGGLLGACAVIPIINSMASWYLTRMQSSGQTQTTASAAKLKTNFWTAITNGYGSSAGHTMNTDLAGAIVLEIIASLIIVMVAMRALRPNGIARRNSSLLVGAAYAAGSFTTVAFTGAALNPARATGAAIIASANGYKGALQQLWVFWVVPLLAGAIVGLILVIAESAKAGKTADAQPAQADSSDQDHAADASSSATEEDEDKAAEPIHKSDEERDIQDFNTVIKQDTADLSTVESDSDEDMNIDYVDKKSAKNADKNEPKDGE
jgi:aquaporin Z